jgi:hypothetical protein
MKNRVEEGTWEHKSKGIENDEGWSGTIYSANSGVGSANSGIGNQIKYISTIDDISTW